MSAIRAGDDDPSVLAWWRYLYVCRGSRENCSLTANSGSCLIHVKELETESIKVDTPRRRRLPPKGICF